jgi:hypothetical protein
VTQTYAGTTSADGTDTIVHPQPTSQLEFSLRNVGTRPLAFTVPSEALTDTPGQIVISVSPAGGRAASEFTLQVMVVSGTERRRTDEELMAGGRAFMAELEQEFGPVPEDVRAEIRRKWHG